MKKHRFLAPLTLAVAALISTVSGHDKAAIAQAAMMPTPKVMPHQVAPTIDDGRILHDFVLVRNENNEMMAYHRSHYSHRSHSSHSSHRSHYSGY